MSSKREQILAAVHTLLINTNGVDGRVFRSRQQAFSRDEAPAIVIEPGRDAPAVVSICKLDWTLDVLVAIYARGVVPHQEADPIVVAMHNELMGDRSLGGLVMDMVPTSVNPQFDQADFSTLWLVCTYQVKYRTSISSLES
ncbi:MAG: hypothetical protein WCF98_08850 [Synechococcus sp. ELA057]|jgi:hypothetical protein